MKKEMPLGVRFSIIDRCYKRQMDQRLKAYELTGVQFGVLRALDRLELSGAAEVKQRDLERMSHVTHPTMAEILQRLEKKDYIVCRRSELDRRSKCIASTERAKSLHNEMRATGDEVTAELCKGLSEEQTQELFAITDIILDNAFSLKGEDDA